MLTEPTGIIIAILLVAIVGSLVFAWVESIARLSDRLEAQAIRSDDQQSRTRR